MRHRQRLVTIVFALIAVAFISAACGGDDDSDTPATPATPATPEKFGGPYPLPSNVISSEKISSFWVLGGIRLPYADRASLTRLTLTDSIEENRSSGRKLQRYNYVIIKSRETTVIVVAIWTTSNVGAKVAARDICTGTYTKVLSVEEIMVDFWVEDPTVPVLGLHRDGISPCQLIQHHGSLDVGILDAISKHFFLAQGDNGATIDIRNIGFDAGKWAGATVSYAGEIIVDLRPCDGDELASVRILVNNGSGTYQPEAGTASGDLTYLEAVAKKFGDDADIQVSEIYNSQDKKNGPTLVEGSRGTPIACSDVVG